MIKIFHPAKFGSSEFYQKLNEASSPYGGNDKPIKSVEALIASLSCKTAVFEYDYVDKDYQDEYAVFYSKAFKKYSPRAVRLHFFSSELSDADVPQISSFADAYLGFLILRPTDLQRVGRTVLRSNLNRDQEFIHCQTDFTAHILGHKLTVTGMPFIQQDTQVGACAQASLWMLARYMSRRFGHREFLPSEINQLAKAKGAMGRALPAEFGLNWKQMLDALEGMGFFAWSYSKYYLDDCSKHIDDAFPKPQKATPQDEKNHEQFVQTLKLADIAYRYIESGLPVIFGTSDHALVGIGHTYDHAAQATTSIQRIPEFFVHNDAIGPYQRMPISTNLGGGLLFQKVDDIIVVAPPEVTLRGEEAESMSRKAITKFLSKETGDLQFPTYRNLTCRYQPAFKQLFDSLEYRTFLMPSVEFQNKLRCDTKNTKPTLNRFDPVLAERLIALDYPKFVWITEVSSSELLNHPQRHNRQCLGRVIIDSTAPAGTNGEMAVHFADFLGMLDRQTGSPQPWEHVPNTTPFGHQISQ